MVQLEVGSLISQLTVNKMSGLISMNMYWKIVMCFVILTGVEVNSQFYLAKIIQGRPTTIDQYPILAQLLLDAWDTKQYVQHCAGVILTSRHVISTAHCYQYNGNTGRDYSLPRYWKIRVGSTYRTRGGAVHDIKTIIHHPNFDKTTYTNDLAVIVVTRQFRLNNSVRQGTLVKQGVEIKPGSFCGIVGWGLLEPSDGQQPDQLQHTTIYTIDHNTCKTRYASINAVIGDSMMCAGRLDLGGPDGCFGDSGGPLIYKGLVAGLVSFGYSCGHKYYPGVYTKISYYTNWIVKTILSNK